MWRRRPAGGFTDFMRVAKTCRRDAGATKANQLRVLRVALSGIGFQAYATQNTASLLGLLLLVYSGTGEFLALGVGSLGFEGEYFSSA
jgi:hypothetical protein